MPQVVILLRVQLSLLGSRHKSTRGRGEERTAGGKIGLDKQEGRRLGMQSICALAIECWLLGGAR